MDSSSEDPFITPKTSARERGGGLDTPPVLTLPTTSPSQLKRTLQAHLSETQKRLDGAAQLGNDLMKQSEEIEARLKELEESGENVTPELKGKLADLEKEYNEVGRETARALLTNKIMGGGTSPYGQGQNGPPTSAPLQSQGSSSPTKLNAPSRRQRNQPSRQHDLEFAAELGQGLLVEVRKLQHLLSEREAALKDVESEKSRLEEHAEQLESRIKLAESDSVKYRDQNWDLEGQVQELRKLEAEHKDTETRFQAHIAQLEAEKNMVIKELDDLKHNHGVLAEESEAKYKHYDVEVTALRRSLTTSEAGRATLQKRVDELKQDLEESQRISLRLRQMDLQRSDGEDRGRGFDALPVHSDDTPEHSPAPSPAKHTPRHSMLESETLKSSLHHAHRMITNLKSNIHREKSEKAELKRLLQDARDELDTLRNGFGDSPRQPARKRNGTFKKPIRPNVAMLGSARKSRDEITVLDSTPVDDDWEETHEDINISQIMRGAPGAYFSDSTPTISTPDETSAFETANENTDVFETANELDDTETEAYRTGLESPSRDNPTSMDEMTETEDNHLRTLRSKPSALSATSGRSGRTLRNNRSRQRLSVVSTASTEDEADGPTNRNFVGAWEASDRDSTPDFENAPMTPIAITNPRLKLRINRARSRGARLSENSIFNSGPFSETQSTPPSMDDSPIGGRPRHPSIGAIGKSLFAELGESPGMASTDNDEEPEAAGDPAKLAPSPMVVTTDSGMMTDDYVPEVIVQEVVREVPVEIIREVIREVPVEIEKEIIKEVIREVPFEVVREVIKEVPVDVIREVIKEVSVDVVREVVREVPVEVIKEVVRDVPFEVVREIIREVPVEVIREVIREVPVEVIREVIKEVPVEVEKEILKEVPVEVIKEVFRDVPVEVIKEVPVEVIKEVFRDVPVEVVREVVREVPAEGQAVREVPVEIIKEVVREVPVEVEKEIIKEVIREIPVEVEREVIKEVIKEVPFEVVKEIVREVPIEVVREVIKEVPIEVIREVIKEVPIEIEKEVIREVIKEVPVEIEKEVIREVIREVPIEVEKEILKEVPVEVIKEVFRDVPVEVIKEVFRDVPYEVVREVIREVPRELPAMSEASTQCDGEQLKIDTSDAGVQSSEELLATRTTETGTQSDPHTESREAISTRDMETQFEPSSERVDDKDLPVMVTSSSRADTNDVAAAAKLPFAFSSIKSLSTAPVEPQASKSGSPAPVPALVDASTSSDDDTTPKKVSETVEEARQRPTTPSPQGENKGLLATFFGYLPRPALQEPASQEPASQGPRLLESALQDPEPEIPVVSQKEQQSVEPDNNDDTIRMRKLSKARPSIPASMADQGAQTDLSGDFFEKPAAAAKPGYGSIRAVPPSLKSRGSQESLGRMKSRSSSEGSHFGAGMATKRPGSASSKEVRSNHPPLPIDHQQHIVAAQLRAIDDEILMPPPPLPIQGGTLRSVRPQTPVQVGRPETPVTPGSRGGRTPRPAPRFSASRSEVSSPVSRRSSLSSFVSELDDRFHINDDGLPKHQHEATDPRVIQAITQTMIGEYLWKYTRNPGGAMSNSSRHKRFFWVHPYTRTLYWSDRDPTAGGKAELRAKSVPIESVLVVEDPNPMPPGLHQKSLLIRTPGRSIKFTAPTSQRHETWFNALSYLLLRTGGEVQEETADAEMHDVPESPSFSNSIRGFGSSFRSSSRTTRTSSPSRTVSSSRVPSSLSNRRPTENARYGSISRLSNIFRPASGTIRSGRETPDVYDDGSMPEFADNLNEEPERDQLENVRACCDGKHDVGTLTRKNGHAHTHHHGSGRVRKSTSTYGSRRSHHFQK